MIKIIKCKENIHYADYTQYKISREDHIIFDMSLSEYIPASMIGFLMNLKQRGIKFDLVLSSQIEYILRFKKVYNYLMGESV